MIHITTTQSSKASINPADYPLEEICVQGKQLNSKTGIPICFPKEWCKKRTTYVINTRTTQNLPLSNPAHWIARDRKIHYRSVWYLRLQMICLPIWAQILPTSKFYGFYLSKTFDECNYIRVMYLMYRRFLNEVVGTICAKDQWFYAQSSYSETISVYIHFTQLVNAQRIDVFKSMISNCFVITQYFAFAKKHNRLPIV